jgi:hypothetical protein
MKKRKSFIIDLYNRVFNRSSEKTTVRKLVQNPKTGKLDWSKGDEKFKEDPKDIEVHKFHLEDSKNTRTAFLRVPTPIMAEPFFKNRFYVEFPGIEGHHFNSYSYNGKDTSSDSKMLTSKMPMSTSRKNHYSTLRVLLTMIEICDKLLEIESESSVGDVKINMLDPTGVTVKTILLPECEVVEVKYFDNLSYGVSGEKNDDVLYGEIIIKHKSRKIS